MLMAHPAILRNLVERYEELQVAGTAKDSLENRRRLEDVTYTLCVSTGTRTIEDALRVAEEQLAAALDPAETDVRLSA
ncbi:DUF5133 domain-containing protein [Streptomyces sp. NBC_01317]|uniref:DUF5133 domain-containing protein n=1 Tax=Streptomyces sp. NBC_01317 TaxID=2903822 RepID=UPI002E0F337E|nr:DUF5133 domain-containing protein [Streptomyces sp. NBC_01317]